ncbi:MAG: molybdopterin-dependent oxidoreductase [bacterium]
MKRKIWLPVLLLGLLVLSGCAGTPAANETDDRSIAVNGLAEAAQITLTELKEITPAQGEAISINSNGDEKLVAYKGAELGDVLAKFGADKASFTGVRLVAEDGYAIEVPEEVLCNRQIILAYELNGELLDEGEHPVRIVVPEERAMYWIKYVSEVCLIADGAAVRIGAVRFFENELKALTVKNYDYYGTNDKAVLLTELLGITGDRKVVLIGRDGLVKNELLETAKYDYVIKYTGSGAPYYLAPDLPLGMHVKELAAIIKDDTAIVFAASFAGADGQLDGATIMEALQEYWPEGEISLRGGNGQEETLSAAAFGAADFVLDEAGVRQKQ